jgi:hypothetical protein
MTQLLSYTGQLFRSPYSQPLSVDGKLLLGAYRMFYLTNSTTIATVYADAGLTLPLTQPVFSSTTVGGFFPAIYLNPAIEYRSQLFDSTGRLLEDVDTVNNNTGGAPYISGYGRAAFKAGPTTRTSTTTLTADPELSVYLPAAGTYKVDMDLVFEAGTAGGTPGASIELEFSGKLGVGSLAISGSATGVYNLMFMGTMNGIGNQNIPTPACLQINSPYTGIALGTTPIANTMRWTGTFQSLTAGTLALYWAQAVSSSAVVSLLAGSSLSVLQVA